MENVIASNDNGRASKTTAAQDIRAALKAAFPGVKFSVRKESYSSVRVTWTDGPPVAAVDAIADQWSAGTFDGMTDSYSWAKDRKPNAVQYVFTSREYSEGLEARVRADLLKLWAPNNDYETDRLVHQLTSKADLRSPYSGVAFIDDRGFEIQTESDEADARDLLAGL